MAKGIPDSSERVVTESVTSTGESLGNDYFYLTSGQTISCSARVNGGANSRSIVFLTAFSSV